MTRLEGKHYAAAAAALAVLAYITYQLAIRARENADLTAPSKQPAPEDSDAAARLGDLVGADGHQPVCMPHEHHAGYVYTPHRYPRTVGGEVSSAIHKGFSSMRVPAVTDAQWIISPPSEAAW